jgi:hypothetical protein
MRFTNSFFNAKGPSTQVYVLPTCFVPRVGYAFAEFTAARQAIDQAYSRPNWDGDGALPIREETKKNALTVLKQLEIATCAPEITPNPNGTLSFEWETAKGFGHLEIGRTRYSFCVQPRNGSPTLDSGDVSDMDISVGWVVDGLLFPKQIPPVSATCR